MNESDIRFRAAGLEHVRALLAEDEVVVYACLGFRGFWPNVLTLTSEREVQREVDEFRRPPSIGAY